jgi:hypothetical protein
MHEEGTVPSISWQIRASETLSPGRCVYRRSDFSLEYKPNREAAPAQNVLVPTDIIEYVKQRELERAVTIAVGDLVLVCRWIDGLFLQFDAYTNDRQWVVTREDPVPYLTGSGELYARWSTGEADYGSLEGEPCYKTSEDRTWVKIEVATAKDVSYYQVAQNLVVGLSQGMLVDIVMLNLQHL